MQKEILFHCVLHLLISKAFTFVARFEDVFQNHYPESDAEHAEIVSNPATTSIFCSPGNVTDFIEDVKDQPAIMSCCNYLDTCVGSDFILPNFEKHGLDNTMKYIASSCDCNGPFVNCLKNINTKSAIDVYRYYLLSVKKCFKMEQPIRDCEYCNTHLNCVKYNYDDGVSRHQWFDHYESFNDDIGVLKDKTFPPKARDMVQAYSQFQHGHHHMFQSEPTQQPQDLMVQAHSQFQHGHHHMFQSEPTQQPQDLMVQAHSQFQHGHHHMFQSEPPHQPQDSMVQAHSQFQHGHHHMFQSDPPQQPQDPTWTFPPC